MKRNPVMGRALAFALALLATTAVPAQSAPADVRTVQADGHAVAYRVLGSGRPVLVLISGLGDGMASFKDVAPDLARSATVILYDRAGYGASGPVAGPRDALAADRELLALLQASGVPGPYVIAGHSLGGLYAEAFAARHPDLVAGLILEESRPAGFTRRCEAAAAGPCAYPAALARLLPKGGQAELAALPEAVVQVEAAGPVRDRPVLVISRPAPAKAKPFDRVWSEAQADLAARYAGARHVAAPAGGHNVHRDQRAWFTAEVAAFLAAVP